MVSRGHGKRSGRQVQATPRPARAGGVRPAPAQHGAQGGMVQRRVEVAGQHPHDVVVRRREGRQVAAQSRTARGTSPAVPCGRRSPRHPGCPGPSMRTVGCSKTPGTAPAATAGQPGPHGAGGGRDASLRGPRSRAPRAAPSSMPAARRPRSARGVSSWTERTSTSNRRTSSTTGPGGHQPPAQAHRRDPDPRTVGTATGRTATAPGEHRAGEHRSRSRRPPAPAARERARAAAARGSDRRRRGVRREGHRRHQREAPLGAGDPQTPPRPPTAAPSTSAAVAVAVPGRGHPGTVARRACRAVHPPGHVVRGVVQGVVRRRSRG